MNRLQETLASFGRETVKTFRLLSHNPMGMFGFCLATVIILASFLGPLVWPAEAEAHTEDINLGISLRHLLGTDFMGRDNLRMVVNGGRDVIVIGFLTGLIATAIAVTVGAISAVIGGQVDSLLIELINIWLTIPKFPLLAVMATVVKLNDIVTLSILMALLDWPGLARQVRSQVLSLRQRDYVEAATLLDMGNLHVIFREILPNMMSFIVISMIFSVVEAIYQQTGLVFLGIVPYSSANWGVMITAALRRSVLYNPQAMWSILAPMGAIILFQLGLVSFARSLDEVFNPRLRTSV